MSTETNDIIMRMRLEGAGEVSSALNRMASDAESSALRISKAYDGTFASLRKIAGITFTPQGIPISRTYTNPMTKNPGFWNIGKGFGMKVDNLGLANLLRDFRQLQESMMSVAYTADKIERKRRKESFAASRLIMSSSLANWMSDNNVGKQLLLDYKPQQQAWTQDEVNAFEDMREQKKRNEHLERLKATREKYSWVYDSGYSEEERRRILSALKNRFTANAGGGGGETSIDAINNANKEVKGLTSNFSKMTGFLGKVMNKFTRIGLILNGLTQVLGIIRKIIASAREHFYISKLSEASAMGGLSSGSRLFPYMQQMNLLGGDPASVSAHAASFANDMGMLSFGGNGGRMLEAARLFGVSIHGSGRNGFVTYEEWMRNIATRMKTLDPQSRVALKNVAGLSDEQFFAVRNGAEAFEAHKIWSTTLLERFERSLKDNGLNELAYSFGGRSGAFHQDVSMDWVNAQGVLKESFDELSGVIGDAVLPMLTFFSNALSSVTQVVSAVISPFTKAIGFIFDALNTVFFGENPLVENTPPNGMSAGEYYNNENYSPALSINIGSINQADLGLSPNASKQEIEAAYRNFLGNIAISMGAHGRRA